MGRPELQMPAVALRGMTILPEMITHFDVSRTRSVKAVERALTQEQKLFIVTQKNPETEKPQKEDLFSFGTVVEIKQIVKMPHNILRVLVEGLYRAELLEIQEEEYLEVSLVQVEQEGFDILHDSASEAMYRNLQDIFQKYADNTNKIGKDIVRQVMESTDLERLIVQVMIHTPLGWERQQKLLDGMVTMADGSVFMSVDCQALAQNQLQNDMGVI